MEKIKGSNGSANGLIIILGDSTEYIKPYSVKLIFAWYDFWIGFFIDKKKKLIYFFPIPMVGIRYKYGYLDYEPKK